MPLSYIIVPLNHLKIHLIIPFNYLIIPHNYLINPLIDLIIYISSLCHIFLITYPPLNYLYSSF